MIGELRTRLLTSSDIDTVEPYLREDNEDLPVVVYEVTDDEYERDLQGGSDLRRTTVALRCYATSYLACDELIDAVDDILDGWTDTEEKIWAAERVSVSRAYALPIESSNQLLYEGSVEVVVHWNRSSG